MATAFKWNPQGGQWELESTGAANGQPPPTPRYAPGDLVKTARRFYCTDLAWIQAISAYVLKDGSVLTSYHVRMDGHLHTLSEKEIVGLHEKPLTAPDRALADHIKRCTQCAARAQIGLRCTSAEILFYRNGVTW